MAGSRVSPAWFSPVHWNVVHIWPYSSWAIYSLSRGCGYEGVWSSLIFCSYRLRILHESTLYVNHIYSPLSSDAAYIPLNTALKCMCLGMSSKDWGSWKKQIKQNEPKPWSIPSSAANTVKSSSPAGWVLWWFPHSCRRVDWCRLCRSCVDNHIVGCSWEPRLSPVQNTASNSKRLGPRGFTVFALPLLWWSLSFRCKPCVRDVPAVSGQPNILSPAQKWHRILTLSLHLREHVIYKRPWNGHSY